MSIRKSVGTEQILMRFNSTIIPYRFTHLVCQQFAARLFRTLGDLDLCHAAKTHHLLIAFCIKISVLIAYTVKTAAHLQNDIRQIQGYFFWKSLQRCIPVDTIRNEPMTVKKITLFIFGRQHHMLVHPSCDRRVKKQSDKTVNCFGKQRPLFNTKITVIFRVIAMGR